MKAITIRLNGEKVIFNNACQRILCNNQKMNFVELYVSIKKYIKLMKGLTDIHGLTINVTAINKGMSFNICGLEIDVKVAFELYGEIRKIYSLDYERLYNKN
jgi:hypothetical protein